MVLKNLEQQWVQKQIITTFLNLIRSNLIHNEIAFDVISTYVLLINYCPMALPNFHKIQPHPLAVTPPSHLKKRDQRKFLLLLF